MRVKSAFKELFHDVKHEFGRFSGKSAPPKEIEVSWPQNVVKTVEFGEKIDRPVEIHNPHERLAARPSTESNGQNKSSNFAASGQRNVTVEDVPEDNATLKLVNHVDNIPTVSTRRFRTPLPELPSPLGNEKYSSVQTADLAEWISEPRNSWRQSEQRTRAIVSKVRPMKATMRPVVPRAQSETYQDNVDARTLFTPMNASIPTTTVNPLPVNAPGLSSPPRFRAAPQTHQSQPNHASHPPPVSPKIVEDPPKRREFIYPSAIGVNKKAWRYSVQASNACDTERINNRYSLHGEGFSNLHKLIPITDPEILAKMEKIRHIESDNKEQVRPAATYMRFTRSDEGPRSNPTQHHPGPNYHPPATYQTATRLASIPPKPHPLPSEPQPQHPSHDGFFIPQPQSLASPPPLPPRTPASSTSALSTNIRTPKGLYGPTFSPRNRTQVPVYPIETKAEYSKRGRAPILERWNETKLKQRREDSAGIEIVREDGSVWRSADIVLGRIGHDEGVKKTLLESDWKTINAKGPTVVNQPLNFGPVPGVVPPTRHSVLSSFSDLLSISGYPPRPLEDMQRLPPAPSRGVLLYKRASYPPAACDSPLPLQPFIRPHRLQYEFRQPGPWDMPDFCYPPKPTPLSSTDALDILYKYVSRPLPPHASTLRNQRLQEAASYFPSTRPENVYFPAITEMVEYITTSYHSISRPQLSGSVTTLNQTNLLRLLVTNEMLPWPTVQEDLYDELVHFRHMWPISQDLGLRPLVFLHLIHEPVGLIVFLSTEDDALYLWSRQWDDGVFGGRRLLIRAGKTIDECEEGITKGLHATEFEHGGWLKIDGRKNMGPARMASPDEDCVNWYGRKGHIQI
jgi:hypothetical protein